jgi:putative peptide zinc metalloprotease protein
LALDAVSRALFSQQWYRVKDLCPRLRSHAEVHRQVFRDEVWYIIEDRATGAMQRVSEAGYRLVGLMNGRRTVDEIWRRAGELLGDALPSQEETIELLIRLHQADVLHAELPPDMLRVTERGAKTRHRRAMQSFKNPLAIRVPLLDPDGFLRSTLWAVRPFMGWFGAVVWVAAVGSALVLLALHGRELSANVADRVLTAGNLVHILATYPIIKALHELGHGYATRRWGGAVHEIGVMFLVFLPVPYVDASTASAFRSKWQRAGVAAAGIIVELFLAAIAMILWTALEPGLLRAMMLNVMLVAGISTLLFNGNPLLKFDGYYVLSDLAEIPNLGPRSNQYLLYLIQRYLFGLEDARSPALARGERGWFVVYGLASLVYRLAIMATIILFVAGRFFEVGLALALWALVLLVAVPTAKGLHFVVASPRLEGRRRRAVTVTVVVGLVLAWTLGTRPVPRATVVEGIVWAPEHAIANAGADGFVAEVIGAPGQRLAPGDPILRIEDPLLDARISLLESRVGELELRRLVALSGEPAELDIAKQELALAEEELDLATDLAGERLLASEGDGVLLLPGAEELVGRFVRKGDTLAYVVGPNDAIIRAVVGQDEVDLVRRETRAVSVRLASRPMEVHPARVLRAAPQATNVLPSPALATSGGGRLPLDPAAQDGLRSLESLFVFDLDLTDGTSLMSIGERVHVRFEHEPAPIIDQVWRSLRQIFLRDLNV